jgi:hypothetical protein
VLLYCATGLEKDIAGLKREIRERDETIGDKERRIYELKKKNQELEKFKFVLDYKIKELKKQVGVSAPAVGQGLLAHTHTRSYTQRPAEGLMRLLHAAHCCCRLSPVRWR